MTPSHEARDSVQGAWPGGGVLGDFVLLREIGRGGMGVVYEAEQTTLGRRVALKVLPAVALDAQRLERFRREAQAAARLHHTNIVPVFGVGETAGVHYYIMQYIEGQALDRVLKQIGEADRAGADPIAHADTVTFAAGASLAPPEESHPATSVSTHVAAPKPASSATAATSMGAAAGPFWKDAARIGAQVAEALAHAHDKGVLHRDIKPANVLLDKAGAAWVTDFGLAKFAEADDLTAPGAVVGTLRYMPPERFQGQADARGDVYSLGLTLYEMLALRPAFDETGHERLFAQVSRAEPAPPSRWRRGIPRDLETVVLKAIARDPAHRYQTAAALAEDLRRVVDDRPVLARRAGPLERWRRWSRRNPLVASLSAALVLVLLATALGSTIAAFNFRELANAESEARGDADAKAKQLSDQIERLNKANGLLDRAGQREATQDWAGAGADYDEAIELRPDHSQAWAARAVFHLRIGLLDEAAVDLERTFALRLPSDPQLWYYRGCLFAYRGDAAKYREHCQNMVKHFGGEADMELARWIIATCTLAPEALPDMSRLIPVALTAESKPGARYPFQLALGLRRGASGGHEGRETHTLDRAGRIVLLMLQAKGGQAEEARAKLVGGKDRFGELKWLDSSLDSLARQPLDSGPLDRDGFSGGRGETLRWLGDYVLLREASQMLLKKPLEHALPAALRARGLAMLARWKDAEDAQRVAFKLTTDLPYVHLERARLNAHQGRWAEVNDDLARALKHNPRDPAIRLAAAKLLSRNERWKDALPHYDVLIAETERPPPPFKGPIPFGEIPALASVVAPAVAYVERGRCHLRLGELDRAAKDYAAALQKSADMFQPHDPGVVLRLLSRYPAGKTPPNLDHKLRFFKVVVYLEVAQDEALYEKVAALRKGDDRLTLERAEFLAAQERWDEAATLFLGRIERERKARKIEAGLPGKDLYPTEAVLQDPLPWQPVVDRLVARLPQPNVLWAAAGLFHARKGETEAAVAAFRRALDRLPPGEQRAFITSSLVRYDDVFARLVKDLDDSGPLWFKRGEYLGRLKTGGAGKLDMELAGPAFAEALRRAAKDFDLLKSLAETYRSTGDLESAAEAYEKAHALRPFDQLVVAELGKVLSALRRWPQAAAVYDHGLEAAAKMFGAAGDGPRNAIYKVLTANEELFEAARKRRPLDARLLLDRAVLVPGPAGDSLRKEAFALSKDGSAWLLVAQQHAARNEWDEAIKAYVELLRHEPKAGAGKAGAPPAHVLIARQSNLDCLVRVARALPDHASRLWLERARLSFPNYSFYPTLGHARDRVALFLKDDPEQPVLWLEKARIARRARDHAGAMDNYVRAMACLEKTPPLELHGILYREAIQAEEAAFPETKADWKTGPLLKRRAEDPWLWFFHGALDLSRGIPGTFETNVGKALELRPGDPWLLLQRARHRASLGRWKDAATDLDLGAKATDLGKDTVYSLEYATILGAAGRTEEARGVAMKMLTGQRMTAAAPDAQRAALAGALFVPGDEDKKEILRLAEVASRQPTTLSICTQALAEYRAGQVDKADARMQPLVRVMTEGKEPSGMNTLARLIAGLAAAGAGNKEGARTALTRALGDMDRVFPDGKECKMQPPGAGYLWAMCVVLRPEGQKALAAVR
ncbi:MAG: protein kinase [Gemmataceae bacterium]